MENKANRPHPMWQKLGLSLLTVLLVALIVFTTYYFTLNKEDSKYINSLYKFKVVVDKCNSDVVDIVKNIDNIDIKDTKKIANIKSQISDVMTNLQNVLQDIHNLKPPSKYSIQYNNYVNGIYTNRKIFMQVNLILKNTTSNNIDNALNDLYSYVTETSKFYELSKLKKAYISLPSGIIGMPEKVHQYAFKSFNDYENRSQNFQQYTAYFKSMDVILLNFNNTKIDLGNYIGLINNAQMSYDDVYVKIEDKLSELASIENSYNLLSPPSKMGSRHSQLNDIIKLYTNYCQGFKDALTKYEEVSTGASIQAGSAFTLNELKIEYKTISKRFIDYRNAYNGDKTKYSDINNL